MDPKLEFIEAILSRTVDVTQEHIDRGEMGDIDFCPIALAGRETLPVGTIRVLDYIIVGDEVDAPHDECYRIGLDNWLKQFDRGMPVSPIKIEFRRQNDGTIQARRGYPSPRG